MPRLKAHHKASLATDLAQKACKSSFWGRVLVRILVLLNIHPQIQKWYVSPITQVALRTNPGKAGARGFGVIVDGGDSHRDDDEIEYDKIARQEACMMRVVFAWALGCFLG